MNEEHCEVEKKKENPTPPRGGGRAAKKSTATQYPFELKLRAVKLHLEEGFTLTAITEELNLGVHTLANWARRYQLHGEEGLMDRRYPTAEQRHRLHSAVTAKILEVK